MTSQFIRAAFSVALNIAEGSGDTDAQYNRFLQIANNSVKESIVCSRVANRQNYITVDQENETKAKRQELSKTITALKNTLKRNTND